MLAQEICYCVLNEVAALLWAVNLGSLEIHTSLHTQVDLHRPTWLVFDLDPGEGVDVLGWPRWRCVSGTCCTGWGCTRA